MSKRSMDLIYREYKNDVYRYLYYLCRNHHNAEDLMQETFYRACGRIEDLEGKKTRAWLFRVAYNAYIDRLRKESRSTIYEDDYFHNVPCSETPEAAVVEVENREELFKMLSQLTPNQQHAVLLYDIHGFSYQESANLMGVGLSHFKILLYRARQKLRKEREIA